MRLGLKGLTFLLLTVLLVLCSSVHLCDARSSKHLRHSRAPSTSLLRGKGKSKSSSSHKQNGKGNQSPYQPSPSTSPTAPGSSSGGGQGPTMPTPSSGTGYTLPPAPPLPPPPPLSIPAPPSQGTVFNVVDFGAKGDGVTDDTQVTIAAFEILCFQLGRFCHLHHIFWVGISFPRHPGILSLLSWLLLLPPNNRRKLMSINITPQYHHNIWVQFRMTLALEFQMNAYPVIFFHTDHISCRKSLENKNVS